MSFAAKEKKSIYKIKDKQTPHTVLQKLSPKARPTPLKVVMVNIKKKKKKKGLEGFLIIF